MAWRPGGRRFQASSRNFQSKGKQQMAKTADGGHKGLPFVNFPPFGFDCELIESCSLEFESS
jgi:hypothetical protein